MDDFTFGVFADVQYDEREPAMNRYYRNSPGKVHSCLSKFSEEGVQMCVHLGDLVDAPDDEDRGERCAERMMELIRETKIPCVFVPGNHDTGSVSRDFLAQLWGLPADRFYRSFNMGNLHFVVLDSNYDANGIPYTPRTHQWDASFLGAQQLAWLDEDLQAVPEYVTTVVLVHALLDDLEDPHVIRDAAKARAILEKRRGTVLVLQGHRHCGGESETNGIRYCTLKATVEGPTDTCFWIIHSTGSSLRAEIHSGTGKTVRSFSLCSRP